MFKTPSHLHENHRTKIVEKLNATLADGLDLHSHSKFAHWNVKGPQFMPMHELFEKIAGSLDEINDDVAERAVTLGGRAIGTSRQVGAMSRVPEYPKDATRDLDHVRFLAERVEKYLEGARDSRDVAEEHEDEDTADLMTGAIREMEKYGWFLRATLEG